MEVIVLISSARLEKGRPFWTYDFENLAYCQALRNSLDSCDEFNTPMTDIKRQITMLSLDFQ